VIINLNYSYKMPMSYLPKQYQEVFNISDFFMNNSGL
jgi:hypothetical protein